MAKSKLQAEQVDSPLPEIAGGDRVCRVPTWNWPLPIESVDDLDRVLSELSRIQRVTVATRAKLDREIAALTVAAEKTLAVDTTWGGSLPFADWESALRAAAEKYCDKHRNELLPEGRKSLKLNHGTIGWENEPEHLAAAEEFPDSGNDEFLNLFIRRLRELLVFLDDYETDADHSISNELFAAVGQVQAAAKKIGASRFVEIKMSWRKKDLLRAFVEAEIRKPMLARAGFDFVDVAEEFYIREGNGLLASNSKAKK